MHLALTVGIVAIAIWIMAVGFALALARTAKSADRAGRHLVISARSVGSPPHPVVR